MLSFAVCLRRIKANLWGGRRSFIKKLMQRIEYLGIIFESAGNLNKA